MGWVEARCSQCLSDLAGVDTVRPGEAILSLQELNPLASQGVREVGRQAADDLVTRGVVTGKRVLEVCGGNISAEGNEGRDDVAFDGVGSISGVDGDDVGRVGSTSISSTTGVWGDVIRSPTDDETAFEKKVLSLEEDEAGESDGVAFDIVVGDGSEGFVEVETFGQLRICSCDNVLGCGAGQGECNAK